MTSPLCSLSGSDDHTGSSNSDDVLSPSSPSAASSVWNCFLAVGLTCKVSLSDAALPRTLLDPFFVGQLPTSNGHIQKCGHLVFEVQRLRFFPMVQHQAVLKVVMELEFLPAEHFPATGSKRASCDEVPAPLSSEAA